MQCSGIHRSLGVHISKVRSATLDTWLPEQIAFIQSMGNEKSNCYWEAELPPNYNRVGIENFIRAKYEEKKWIPRDSKAKSPPQLSGEKVSIFRAGPENTVHKQMKNNNHAAEERKITPPNTNDKRPASKSCTPAPASVNAPQQVALDIKPQPGQNSEQATVTKAQLVKEEEKKTPVSTPAKVDYATELFNLLCMDDSGGNCSKPSTDGFKSVKEESTSRRSDLSNISENKQQFASSIEQPQKYANNDIMNLFQSGVVSPLPAHQQQLSTLSQQNQALMAAAVQSGGLSHTFPVNVHKFSANGIHLSTQNWGSTGHQVPGMMMPLPSNNLPKYIQIGSNQQMYTAGNSVNIPVSSMYSSGPVAPINGATNIRSTMAAPAFQVPAMPTQPQGYYDFSSLTQGMFRKR
ncbi:hypothetical protein MANES_16G021800v8 [Manihot esculenta]|nr:hypothetical protein MANES_16G021800v8 [Manihot esculenta]